MRGAEVAAPELVLQTQQFSESSAWTTFSVTPSFLLVSGDPGEDGRSPVATTGSPALLLAHSRVIGMRRNQQMSVSRLSWCRVQFPTPNGSRCMGISCSFRLRYEL